MNLINDPWIPVRRADTSRDWIKPSDLTDWHEGKSPIIALASPRPDFDGALVQFMIGLLSSTCTPETPKQWRDWRKAPPSVNTLFERFRPIEQAFELDGEGPRFMQDLTLGPKDFEKKKQSKQTYEGDAEEDAEGQTGVSNLLIEFPGELTRKENRDHFIKRDAVEKLCPSCTAMALFTLQTNSPRRGSGYRPSLRGGGPLTTIVLSEDQCEIPMTLWTVCWLNVLDKTKFLSGSGDAEKRDERHRFPWMAATRTSEDKANVTTPVDVHPVQQYWAMPQRIRLVSPQREENTPCDLCGSAVNGPYRYYLVKKHGTNYKGDFRHPLTPYDIVDGHSRAVATAPGGIGYRHWLGLIENEQNSIRHRALVIDRFAAETNNDGRIWAFGFDIYNNNKVRSWTDAELPIFHLDPGVREFFLPIVKNMVVAANKVCGLALRAVLRANFMKPISKKTKRSKAGNHYDQIKWSCPKPFRTFNKSEDDLPVVVLKEQRALLFSARSAFWEATEERFAAQMRAVRDALTADNREAERESLEDWLAHLKQAAKGCFAAYANVGNFDSADPRRIALAEYELNISVGNLAIRTQLGLP